MESSYAEGVTPEQRRSHRPQVRAGSLLPGSLPGKDGLLKVHVSCVAGIIFLRKLEMSSRLSSRNSDMCLFTAIVTSLIHTFLRCCMQSCSFTVPLMYSTSRRRTFCAALHVSVVMVLPLPSLSMLMLSGLGIISSRSGQLGNSRSVISFHRVKRCFNLSNCVDRRGMLIHLCKQIKANYSFGH